ncbi:right-handed parallel beta-helix repeat-containing protein, partial [Kitasatospora sp. NPDC036755]|uniref:right-handed parallel beta-helix repeat-containing protein n=1 Tax=Kitasatospora sp. NPDC036755 TaxID=3154600 RepID=UPI0033CEC2AF
VGLPAAAAGTAAAAGGTLYVNNAGYAHCTDSGTGTQAAPYCTVSAAAAAAQPGQTVEIAAAEYRDTALALTRSGTAEAPITFRSRNGGVQLLGGPGNWDNTIVVKGASHLRFENLAVHSTLSPAVVVDGGHDVSFTNVAVWGSGVRITNASDKVTWARSEYKYGYGPAVQVDGGSTGTVLTTNVFRNVSAGGLAGIVVRDAPNTVVVANTVEPVCSAGIVLDGASSGAVVENNVVTEPWDRCSDPAASTGLTIAADAMVGTKADYNLINPGGSGGVAYNWGGATYPSQQAFTTATGQGAHDFVESVYGPRGPLAPVDHRIDSADETAPGMLSTDVSGAAAVDDPLTVNIGTDSGIRDRGAIERTDVGSTFTPSGPTRLLDTRAAIGVPAAQTVPAGGIVDLQLEGVAGVPASGLDAVTMNVTVTDPQQDGHLTVYPNASSVPNSSSLNWSAGQTIANQVTVPVRNGKVSFYNASGGTVHLIADLAGYYSNDPKGSLFHAQGPTRLLDTRAPIGVPAARAVPAWGTVDLPVTGVAGVPASGVTAVTMNVTVTEPQADGHLTVYPHGDVAPSSSNLNWPAGRSIPNLVTVPVKDGKVSFYNASGGTVHLIADLAGYYATEGKVTYRPTGPVRILDTRQITRWPEWPWETRPVGTVPAWGTQDIPINVSPSVAAVTLNVTVTEPGTDGHLTVYPHGDAAPNASNLNFLSGETIANQVVVPVKDGRISFYNASGAPLHLVVDLFGYQSY